MWCSYNKAMEDNIEGVRAKASDMVEVEGFWEERQGFYKRVSENEEYKKQLRHNTETWAKQLLTQYPAISTNPKVVENLGWAIRGITFIDYFVRNELRTADAPLLWPRVPDSEDPLQKEGIEDLIEKFTIGDFKAAAEQVSRAQQLMDGSAFSVKHNIHLGLTPLYIVREEAIGLGGHLRALDKFKE